MMNVQLNPEELLYLYETTLRQTSSSSVLSLSTDKDILIGKLRKTILAVLEKEHVKIEKNMFATWTSQEAKKIEDLAIQNMTVRTKEKTKVASSVRSAKK
jgi:septum formation topological specificity factor MinE